MEDFIAASSRHAAAWYAVRAVPAGEGGRRLIELLSARYRRVCSSPYVLFDLREQPRAEKGEVINIGSGKGIAVGDLAREIARLMGKKRLRVVMEPARKRPEASEVQRLVCDNRKAKRLLGWEPRTPLAEGLARTIEYIGRHRARCGNKGYVI